MGNHQPAPHQPVTAGAPEPADTNRHEPHEHTERVAAKLTYRSANSDLEPVNMDAQGQRGNHRHQIRENGQQRQAHSHRRDMRKSSTRHGNHDTHD